MSRSAVLTMEQEMECTREEMEKLAFDAHNLRSLCEKCHQNAHKMSKNRGKKAIKERNGREVRRFVKRWL